MKRILSPGRNCWGIYDVTESGIIVDARNYFRSFYRAALLAERFILISGWQFDSTVKLLRGKDLCEAAGDVSFLPFLTSLCERKKELRIYILAWDYNVIFSLEREWFQEWLFKWSGHERMHFVFDNKHPVGGTHHQKFVVIDGAIAFAGGIDLCSFRWDDRSHTPHNDLRVEGSGGRSYDPYHDLQAYCSGPACGKMMEIFEQRWLAACGKRLELVVGENGITMPRSPAKSLRAEKMAISRTVSPTLVSPQEPIQEIRALYLDAIEAAENLIYIENQYFSSTAIFGALTSRMRRPGKKPDIVMILPKKPQALSEKVVHGLPQMRLIRSLKELAVETGTSFGIYYVAAPAQDGSEKMVYIHSKLLIVDDQFLTVGSANTTNRSMGLDTELNVSWEADYCGGSILAGSIRKVRVSLLSEHTGISGWKNLRRLGETTGLVNELDFLSRQAESRLKKHPLEITTNGSDLLGYLTPTFVDSEKSVVDEGVFEALTNVDLLVGGIVDFNAWVAKKSRNQSGGLHISEKSAVEPQVHREFPLESSNGRCYHLLWILGTCLLIIITWFLWRPAQ